MADAVSLEDFPRDAKELEDYVAALFQASGHFVETQVIQRDGGAEVLEADVLATSYAGDGPEVVLGEAKSGRWGYGDIFKVYGWMTHLRVPRGGFFVQRGSRHDEETLRRKTEEMGIAFVNFGDFSEAAARFQMAGFPAVADPFLVEVFRFVNWAERRLVDGLRQKTKSEPHLKGPAAAYEYHQLVNDGVFIHRDVRRRLRSLCAAYQEHPRVTSGIASEMAGGEYDPDEAAADNRLMREALYEGKHPVLQSALYVEHRARLALLKAGVDYRCLREAGALPPLLVNGVDLGKRVMALLPDSFRLGLEELAKGANYRRYPLLWQQFLLGFGGFFLLGYEDTEFRWLERVSGVPAAEVPHALRAFDLLFPLRDGKEWFATPGPTRCRLVKLLPAAIRGLGAFHRLARYDAARKRGEPAPDPSSDYTGRDMNAWIGAAIALLQ